MHALDIMTSPVISTSADTSIQDLATLLLDNHISAVPIVSADGEIEGIVSEGDLIKQIGADDEHRKSWWLAFLSDNVDQARDYVKSHGKTAGDVMVKQVISVPEDCPVEKISAILESNRIKRVFVVRDKKIVGVVSRANLLHALASAKPREGVEMDDRALRKSLLEEIEKTGIRTQFVNAIVTDKTADIYGTVQTSEEKKALTVATKNVPGLKEVNLHVGILTVPGYGT
jgi:CBS domain-containing protein